MPSALDLSLKFGIPIAKVRKLAEHGLQFYDSPVEPDKAFQRAAYEIRYGRIAAFSLAYILRLRRDPTEDNDARLTALLEYAADDYGSAIEARIDALGDVWPDLLPDAPKILESVASGKAWGIDQLALWARSCLDRSAGELGHEYLATRLLLSVPDMLDYPKAIQTALNRLKHAGLLEGYWHKAVAKNGKTATIYHKPLDL